jgi:hypothetical protein
MGLLDFLITPISEEQDKIPIEGLLNLNFNTDIKTPKWKVPINKDYNYYPADMDKVKFGSDLPYREDIERRLIEAGKISGVDPIFTEGFRTLKQNKLLKGHPDSYHMTGHAFDLKISGNNKKDMEYLNQLIKLFPEFKVVDKLNENHIHLQYRKNEN